MLADDDSFEDMDVQSIRDRMLPILENINTSGANLDGATMKTQSLSQCTGYPSENVQHEAVASPRRASISSATSDLSDSKTFYLLYIAQISLSNAFLMLSIFESFMHIFQCINT